jgi:hypothetical protein
MYERAPLIPKKEETKAWRQQVDKSRRFSEETRPKHSCCIGVWVDETHLMSFVAQDRAFKCGSKHVTQLFPWNFSVKQKIVVHSGQLASSKTRWASVKQINASMGK